MTSTQPDNRVSVSRRTLLLGAGGLGAAALATTLGKRFINAEAAPLIPAIQQQKEPLEKYGYDPMSILREFDYGTVSQENGRTVREYKVTAHQTIVPLNSAVKYVTWNLNNRVPAPTLRATQGDRIRVIFENQGGHSHSLHFHGIHPDSADGVKPIRNGKTEIYEFDAEPVGLQLYHCHIAPVTRHVSKGLFGVFIIDPPGGRPPADEIVMVMGGYDLNDSRTNDLYAFNGIPNYYKKNPIDIYQNQKVRLYLLNMIEFDPAVTFHIHANMFDVYRTGALQPAENTDVVTMGTAERHILEFSYPYSGKYMFHPHQDIIAEKGCMGLFNVLPNV